MRIALVSTYPPRPCGIGTFSRDLRDALLRADGVEAVDVAAIVRDEAVEQRPEVVVRIRQDVRGDFPAAARVLERREVDAVVVQHEYGIMGGPDGAHVLSLTGELRTPMVLTLHTVLSEPSAGQAETLRALAASAALVTVFTETARRMLVGSGLVPAERIRVVPHGGPVELLPHGHGGGVRARLRLPGRRAEEERQALDEDRPLLATFGLISPGKGIETAIAAMPAIVARHPRALYLVAGQTHPEVAKDHGEEYRLGLERQVRDLGLEDHVVFDARFLEVDDLATMLAATTIYLTPYRSREQIVSGALTFAVVAGCPVVSTPYFYAEDLLGTGAGVIVGFDDPAAMAAAVNGLLDDPELLRATRACSREIGAELAWPQVGRLTATVVREAIGRGAAATTRGPPAATLPRARAGHLLTLVDDVGILQHADGLVPNRSHGYCTDDMARLAIVALGLRRLSGAEAYGRMLATSLAFLRHAWVPERGGMHNFLSYDRRWLDDPHGGDHLGRTAWALGEVLAQEALPALVEPTRLMLMELLGALETQRSPRTMAFATIGLAHADPDVLGDRGAELLRELAGRLAAQYRRNAAPDWSWPEDVLAYDNARLPQALIAAGRRLGDPELTAAGLEALHWYGAQVGVESAFVHLPGHLGRRRGEPAPGDGDEQPLEAASVVEAEVEALAATGEEQHATRAMRAFEWFLGRNRLDTAVYDFATGGCHDGLGESGPNVNEGAESTLAYLQALLVLDSAGLQASLPDAAPSPMLAP